METAKNRKDASTSSTPTPNKKYSELKNQELNTTSLIIIKGPARKYVRH